MRRLLIALLLVAAPAWGQVASRSLVDGAGADYVALGDVLDTVFTGADKQFSMAIWGKFNDTSRTNHDMLLSRYGAGGSCIGEREVQLYVCTTCCTTGTDMSDSLALFAIDQSDTGNQSAACSGIDSVSDTNWHFLAATYDGSLATLADRAEVYIDGVFATNDTEGLGSDFDINDTGTQMGIGIPLDSAGTVCGEDSGADGQLAYAHVYDRILSVAEINQIMHCPGSVTDGLVGYWPLTDSTTQYDRSGNGNDGTNNGTAASTDGPPIGGCGGGSAQTIGVQ